MYYIPVKASPRYHQMTLEELLYGRSKTPAFVLNETAARTYAVEEVSERFLRDFHTEPLIRLLEGFNASTKELRALDRRSLYRHFWIPKRDGGKRWIDAPEPPLMEALSTLKRILETEFHTKQMPAQIQTMPYHTAAFAYIRGRCHLDAVKKHQKNESKWFAKLDFKNFFGTTTLVFAMRMLSVIFPYCEVCRSQRGRDALYKAVELGFLDGVLPQGTPLSPALTNILMIPIDYCLANSFRTAEGGPFVYTRYADDMIISSRYAFDVHKTESIVLDTLRKFDAPYRLNAEKTRYGSSAGSNYNLGLLLNKDNNITVGYKKKKRFQTMLNCFVLDTLNGANWELQEIQHLEGLRSYYRSIEGETIDRIVKFVGDKHGVDIPSMIKAELTV